MLPVSKPDCFIAKKAWLLVPAQEAMRWAQRTERTDDFNDEKESSPVLASFTHCVNMEIALFTSVAS